MTCRLELSASQRSGRDIRHVISCRCGLRHVASRRSLYLIQIRTARVRVRVRVRVKVRVKVRVRVRNDLLKKVVFHPHKGL